jgi:LysM domain
VSQEDDYGFWDDDRSRATHNRGRRFHHSLDHDVDLDDHSWNSTPRRRESRPKNPLWPRLGALVALGVLALPVAMIMRGSDPKARLRGGDAGAGVGAETAAVTEQPSDQSPEVPQILAVSEATAAATDASQPVVVDPISPPVSISVEAVPQFQADAKVETIEPSTTTASTTAKRETVAQRKRTCSNSYEPIAGDYWILIADKVNVKLSDLLEANGATTDTPIYPGWDICLPWNASAPSAAAANTQSSAASATTVKATSTTSKPTTTTVKATPIPAKPASAAPTATVAPATTASPTTTTAPPPPKNTYTAAQVEQIIRDMWPDDIEDEAIRIATRESNLVPTAKNWCCYGLFQIYYEANRKVLTAWGITSAAMLYDPRTNAYAAYALYIRAGGWGPWS